jgi:hypothetical protein
LRGKCNLYPDNAFIVDLLKLFQASAEDVVHVRMPVVSIHLGESAAGAQAVYHGVAKKLPRVNCPAVILIKTDLFGRGAVDDGPLVEVRRRTEFEYRKG